MENNNNKSHSKKVRNLVILSFLCALVLGVSTYAWFIGMKTVNVSTFEVKVATTEGLYISLDAESWAYNLDINSARDYNGNTNYIDNVELIPVSTIGKIDKTASTMIMFEKGSLTAQNDEDDNGYRLLASRVNNWNHTDDNNKPWDLTGTAKTGWENPEVAKTGYLVFDLFIKNVSGEEYYVKNDKDNEEAIYLTTNSKVTVSQENGIAGTGIENSVRVAFAQIGRVEDVTENYGPRATTITCANHNLNEEGTDRASSTVMVKDTTTGICRDAYIWEPNDMDHVQNAINWYTTSAVKEWSTVVSENGYVKTFAIGSEIKTPGIDVYDRTGGSTTYGEDTTVGDNVLFDMDYFTDTEKMLKGTNRPEFMTLAPNSITKVRVYVYLEGQDIDNYDFASLGRQISVNFGFTKERFQETDIDYEGPNTYITPTDSATVATHNGEQMNGTEIEEGYENSYGTNGVVPTNSAAYR